MMKIAYISFFATPELNGILRHLLEGNHFSTIRGEIVHSIFVSGLFVKFVAETIVSSLTSLLSSLSLSSAFRLLSFLFTLAESQPGMECLEAIIVWHGSSSFDANVSDGDDVKQSI